MTKFKILLITTGLVLILFSLAIAGRVGEEFRINTTTADDQDNPVVSADAEGNYVVVWEDEVADGDGDAVQAKVFNADGTVKIDEFLVNTTIAGDQDQARVVMADDGHFIVVWRSEDEDGDGIWAKIFNAAGTVLVDEFQVNSYQTNDQKEPEIDIDSNGNFVICWASQGQDNAAEGTKYGVFAQRFLADGTRNGDEFLVNTCIDDTQAKPAVGMWADGRFVITWQSRNQVDNYDIYFQRYAANGQPVDEETLANVRVTVKSQSTPAAAVDNSSGNFVITWADLSKQGGDDDFSGVFAKIFDAAGDSLTSDFLVNTTIYGLQNHQSVAYAPDGSSFVITWGGTKQDVPGTIPYGAFGQVFSPVGEKIGPEFLINTWVDGNQDEPVPVYLSNKDFVVVWESKAQTSQEQYTQEPDSSNGCYGQMFTLNEVVVVSVVDIPEDQGEQVQVSWQTFFNDGKLYDSAGQGFPVTKFSVWRLNAETGAACVGEVPFVGEAPYSLVALTVANTIPTEFLVAAHCTNPTLTEKSEPLTGISTDDLPPYPPQNVEIHDISADSMCLSWSEPGNEIPLYYSIYRSIESGNYPEEPFIITKQLSLVLQRSLQIWYWVVTATDAAGNESAYSSKVSSGVCSVNGLTQFPTAFQLSQNYPNPFNPSTRIQFALKKAGYVTLKVFDANGRQTAALIDGELDAGFHKVDWHAADLPSGIYFYQIITKDFNRVKKMILMK